MPSASFHNAAKACEASVLDIKAQGYTLLAAGFNRRAEALEKQQLSLSSSISAEVSRLQLGAERDEIEAGKRFRLASFLQELSIKIDTYIARTDAYRPQFPAVISGRLRDNLDPGPFTRYREVKTNLDPEVLKDMFTTCYWKLYYAEVFPGGPPEISGHSLVSETDNNHAGMKCFRNPLLAILSQDLFRFAPEPNRVNRCGRVRTEQLILYLSLPGKWTFEAYCELHRRAIKDWIENGPDKDFPAEGVYARWIERNESLLAQHDQHYGIYQRGGKTVVGSLPARKARLEAGF